MTALPASTDFTGNTRNEGQVKTFVTDLRAYLSGLFGTTGTTSSTLTALGAFPSAGGTIGTTGANATIATSSAGTSNLTLGVNAGNSIVSGGNYNVTIGDEAGTAIATGDDCVAVGYGSLAANTTGNLNVAVGKSAGYAVSTGSKNILLGEAAGAGLTTGTSNIMIGVATSSPGGGDNDHNILIGDGIAGKGTNTGFISPNGGAMYNGQNSTVWVATSDRRIKKDIVPNTKGLAAIVQIEPKNFYYKSDEELQEEMPGAKEGLPLNKLTTSAIAQELDLIFPEAIERRGEHNIMSVNTDSIFWAMINAIKELSAEIDELKDKLNG